MRRRPWGAARCRADDAPWPLYGGTPQRNMVNLVDKNVPTDWSVEEGKRKNVKWTADLGSKAFGGPVIAGGKIFVGTNNGSPRDPKLKNKTSAVLMAFNEADGKFLWQIVHDIPREDIFALFDDHGLVSTPVVDGQHIYYVTPACEVIAAETATGKISWRYDMRKELKVVPFHCGSCSPLVKGDRLFLITGNGRGDDGKLAAPKAPSFIALNKNDGKLLWQSDLPGERILEGQWTNPVLATVAGKEQIIFPGGDDVIYGLDPASGAVIWKCRCNPGQKEEKAGADKKTQNYIIATPVVAGERLYVGLGVYPDHPAPTRFSHFLCLDITKSGDVSPSSLEQKAGKSDGSALVWSYGGMIQPKPAKGRAAVFGPTMSTAAVHNGLVYISEYAGYLHCLDAMTGQKYWEHDFKAGVWGSAYYVDGKIYQGAEDGSVVIFDAGKKYHVVRQIDMEETIYGTPVVANGVLYIATRSKLFAIAEKK